MLSVVVPAYNEAPTIARTLIAVAGALPTVSKQIVIVDDCSSDGTCEWLKRNLDHAEGVWRSASLTYEGELVLSAEGPQNAGGFSVRTLFHTQNRGKGAAVRTGLLHAVGDVIVIQDADLEYDPNDWSRMLPLIVERNVADVVYGSRFYGAPHRSLYFHHYLGNRLITFLFNLLYDQMLTDIEVCYKMFTSDVLKGLHLTVDDFGVEIEISAQIARERRWRIYEVGITYYGRTYDQGKKINWRDGLKALGYLVKFRFAGKHSSRSKAFKNRWRSDRNC